MGFIECFRSFASLRGKMPFYMTNLKRNFSSYKVLLYQIKLLFQVYSRERGLAPKSRTFFQDECIRLDMAIMGTKSKTAVRVGLFGFFVVSVSRRLFACEAKLRPALD
jgi:hypothetical protein